MLFAKGDSLKIYKEFKERIIHIHCKDMRKNVLDNSLNHDYSFRQAFLEGAFTVPGDGCIDYKPFFELLKEQAKNAGKSGLELKPSDFLKVSNEIQEEVPFLEGNIQAVRLLEKAIDIVDKNPSRATGFRGLIESAFSDVRAALGKGTLDFDSLPPYKQVATIIETIRQKNLQAVLGESGRTISDRDRQIITKVFGDQRSGFASPGELKKLLRQSLAGFKASGKQYKDAIVGDIELLNEDPRYAKQVQVYNTPEYDKYNLDYETLTETLINTKKLLDSDIIDIDL